MKKKKNHQNYPVTEDKNKDLELKDSFEHSEELYRYKRFFTTYGNYRQITCIETAKVLLSQVQRFTLGALVFLSLAAFLINPKFFSFCFLIFMNFLFLTLIISRLWLIKEGINHASKKTNLEESDISQLPNYSILVPLFKEEKVIYKLINSLKNIDYPEEKLQVLLVLEESDPYTINALKYLELPDNFEVVIVPFSYPQTKGKACNYALKFVKGEFVTIYDADDKPQEKQLKLAIAKFALSDERTICVQARLNYYNLTYNWLSQMFAIEYAILFNRILPALDYLGLVIPLGGTSNHFKVKYLRMIGSFDAYNVTEDAELGIRISRWGLKIETFDSITYEECPVTLKAWLKQRSRWIKGFFQTFFVHMRNPTQLLSELGFKKFMSFIIIIGCCNLFYALMPLAYILAALLSLGCFHLDADQYFLLKIISCPTFIIGILSTVWSAYEITKNFKHLTGRVAWIWYPFYHLLHAIAALKSIYELFTSPHYWDKTQHGLSSESKIDQSD